MNKKIFAALTTIAVTTLLSVSATAYAAEGDTATSMTTEVGVGFLEYNPGTGPFQNNLALTFVPQSFNFGDANKVSSNTQSYAQKDMPVKGQFLGVSDDRTAKSSWNVTASLADFVNTADSTDKLENASLVMNLETVQDYKFDAAKADKDGYASPDPSADGSLVGLDAVYEKLYSDVAAGNVTLTAGSSAGTKVLNYNLTSGTVAESGTAAVARKISSVQLNVKGNTATQNSKYTSTIKWVLSDDAA